MLLGFLIDIALGEAEVDHEDVACFIPEAHQEVVGLDVSVDKFFLMHVLDSFKQPDPQHQGGLQRKLTAAQVKEILEVRPEHLNY